MHTPTNITSSHKKPPNIKFTNTRWIVLTLACKIKVKLGIVLMGDAFSFDNP